MCVSSDIRFIIIIRFPIYFGTNLHQTPFALQYILLVAHLVHYHSPKERKTCGGTGRARVFGTRPRDKENQ